MNLQYVNHPDLTGLDYFNEYYMNATGAGTSPELEAAQKSLAEVNKSQSDKVARKDYLTPIYNAALIDYEDRRKYFGGCEKHTTSQTNKKWWCGEAGNPDKKSEAWHSSESKSLDSLAVQLKSWGEELDQINADLPKLEKQIADKTTEVNKLRDNVYMASMTPEQKAAYETAKTQAAAQADATKKSAEIQAQAEAQTTITKAKQRGVIVVGGVIAAVAGVVLYFVFRNKGAKPAIAK
jgi:hypothetical protein